MTRSRRTHRRLAHLSDLHLGSHPHAVDVTRRAVEWLVRADVEHVLVTGDATHRGRPEERALFEELFEPLRRAGRLSVVPGNHDRVGGGRSGDFLEGRRVQQVEAEQLLLVLLDSTGPQNESYFRSDGLLEPEQILETSRLLQTTRRDSLTVVALHHHPLPLPTESFQEALASRLGWPHAEALSLGPDLVRACVGRADLLLHGHRHHSWTRTLRPTDAKSLQVVNAGSTSERGAFLVYAHEGSRLVGAPEWVALEARRPTPAPLRELWTAVSESLRSSSAAAVQRAS